MNHGTPVILSIGDFLAAPNYAGKVQFNQTKSHDPESPSWVECRLQCWVGGEQQHADLCIIVCEWQDEF